MSCNSMNWKKIALLSAGNLDTEECFCADINVIVGGENKQQDKLSPIIHIIYI